MLPRHILQLVFLSAVWGASFPLIRIAAPAFGPVPMALLRCVLAAVVLTAMMHLNGEALPARTHWASITVLAVLTVVFPFMLFNWSGLILPAGYSAVLNATTPLFGVVAGSAFAGEQLTGRKLIGCAMGIAGVGLLVQLGPIEPSGTVLLAVLACITASAGYGFGIILMKRATLAHHPLPASAAVHIAASAVLLVPGAAMSPNVQLRTDAVIALGVLGTTTSGLIYWISMRLMREIPVSAATSSAFMIPMFGILWGALFLGEPFTPGMLPGVALVLVACALVTGLDPLQLVGVRRSRR